MSRTGRIAFGTLTAVLFVAYAAYTLYERHWYLAKIPATIKTDGVVRISGNAVCGAAIFELSEGSQELVRRQGLRFFDSARQARGRKDIYHSFDPWRETQSAGEPPTGSDLRMFELSVSCATLGRSLEQKIINAVRQPGSYVSKAREKILLVAPRTNLVVLAYWD
jgi:hypothetical protein